MSRVWFVNGTAYEEPGAESALKHIIISQIDPYIIATVSGRLDRVYEGF